MPQVIQLVLLINVRVSGIYDRVIIEAELVNQASRQNKTGKDVACTYEIPTQNAKREVQHASYTILIHIHYHKRPN